MTTVVKTQAELDAALAAGNPVINIKSPQGIWIYISASGSATVSASGSATVRASGSATVSASGSATVSASGSATVRASGSATVRAYGSATVSAYDSATVRAYDSATVRAYDSATVRAYGSATVRAYGSATVSAYGSATVSAYDSATVRAYDSATVSAYDSATVRAYDSATVSAYDSATVSAYDSATVSAYDSATVSASKFVAVHLHSARVTHNGGVLIDVTEIDQSDAATWAENHGAGKHTDDELLVYKAVDSDLKSGYGFTYPIGETVVAPDWQMTDACGAGLHFGPSPMHADRYYDSAGPVRFLACAIPIAYAIGITGGGTAKIKARSCRVLEEVDIHGRSLSAVAE